MKTDLEKSFEKEHKAKILGALRKYLDISESSILEIGIGKGRFGKYFSKEFKEYFGIEPIEERLEFAIKNSPKNAVYKKGIAEKIPFERKFNIILYSLSWHYIKDFDKAFDEIERILNNNGVIVIIEPTQDTTLWTSPKLRKDEAEFNAELLKAKLNSIKRGYSVLKNQTKYEILSDENYHDNESKILVLKKV